ncbi:HlyD family secretion protein [Candidatus Hakubella thermalkaliphila]|nr:efflux RND transporter periplasmic adaptor subunit [Candidatus Hakubella thermalkaliphila]GFP29110.1 HlyD family secretion protein [Candidatus Hakubella thermalkaliphila]GFP37485.1 HlyD family secretion protein [Candidatus Hakubella thermalkaliphila]GFP38375.1 HlyD family secretion protein [Candidatus Hakubella thermalkaliphila]GFP41676.1 HlyD family secretion protein [Candidatus Hakubella thermalkaliphila]
MLSVMKRRGKFSWLYLFPAIPLSLVFTLTACGLITGTVELDQETVEVKRGDLGTSISLLGQIFPRQEVSLGYSGSGVVKEIYVSVGDRVNKGDLLVELDDEELVAGLDKAKASAASAEAAVEKAMTEYEKALDNNHVVIQRADLAYQMAQKDVEQAWTGVEDASRYLRKLKEQGMSKAEIAAAIQRVHEARAVYEDAELRLKDTYWDTLKQKEEAAAQIEAARANLDDAQAQLDLAQASVRETEYALAETKLFAPFSGIVARVDFKLSARVNTQDLIVITDLSELHLEADVDEIDVVNLKEGQKVEIKLDAYPDLPLPGKITFVAPTPTESEGIITYLVRFSIEDDQGAVIKPGMSATIDMVIEGVKDALYLPNQAIKEVDGQKIVTVRGKGGRTEEVTIETGYITSEFTEIKSGLQEGDIVVIPRESK